MKTTNLAKRVSINDVALAAGVSRGAVTRALNDKPDINPDTKRKVLEVAERLGYRPSRFAQNLAARQKTRALGYVLKSFRNPFYTDLAAELLAQARADNWQVVIASSEGNSEAETVQKLIGQVDLVAGHFNLPAQSLKEIAKGTPVILLEGRSDIPGVHAIGIDLRSALKEAVASLYAKGAKTIGMIDSDYSVALSGAYSPSPRCQMFLEFLQPGAPTAVVSGTESLAGGEAAMRSLIARHPDLDAVIVFNDVMAIGALFAAFKSNLTVPDRIRIIGIDGLEMGATMVPSLSSILLDRVAIAKTVFEVAESLQDDPSRESRSINVDIPLKLMLRGST